MKTLNVLERLDLVLPLPSYSSGELPRAPGDSHFGMRGLVYLAALEYFEEVVPGGVAALQRALDPALAVFIGQMFIPSIYFDALPIAPISAAAARLVGKPHLDFVRQNARWQAERDIKGIHRLLLGVLSPASIAQRLPRAALRYFNFGTSVAEMHGATTCEARQEGIPAYLVEWYSAAVDGFVTVALKKGGARLPRVSCLGATLATTALTPVTMVFEFAWLS